jgi:hypothetical protein
MGLTLVDLLAEASDEVLVVDLAEEPSERIAVVSSLEAPRPASGATVLAA